MLEVQNSDSVFSNCFCIEDLETYIKNFYFDLQLLKSKFVKKIYCSPDYVCDITNGEFIHVNKIPKYYIKYCVFRKYNICGEKEDIDYLKKTVDSPPIHKDIIKYEILSYLSVRQIIKVSNIFKFIIDCGIIFDICDETIMLTDHKLMKSMYQNLTVLNVNNENITDDSIIYLKNLHTLYASGTCNVTDRGVILLKNLHTLDASRNRKITDVSIKQLLKLKSLDATDNLKITDQGVSLLNLEALCAGWNTNITDYSICRLTNLKMLDARDNETITDRSVYKLINLQNLCVLWNYEVTYNSIIQLTNLQSLSICNNQGITDDIKKNLTNLQTLMIHEEQNL